MKRLLIAALMSGSAALAAHATAPAPVPQPDHMQPPTGRIGELVPTMTPDPANPGYATGTQAATVADTGNAESSQPPAKPSANHLLPPTGRIGELIPPMKPDVQKAVFLPGHTEYYGKGTTTHHGKTHVRSR